jgi:beta-glucanase (GH16 family)
VPNNDGLLNGFFLYGENPTDPSITYEIDMEILKYQGKWQLWSTVYNISNSKYNSNNGLEPGAVYQSKIDLTSDPSQDFHNYKINFYQDYISFYLDNKQVGNWQNEFDYGDMYLHAGSFYTFWLSGKIATENQKMEIAWMRQNFNK